MPNIGRARTASKMWHSTQLLRSAAHIRYMVPCDNIFLSLHRVEGVASIKAVQPWRDSHSETDEYRDILSCADRPPPPPRNVTSCSGLDGSFSVRPSIQAICMTHVGGSNHCRLHSIVGPSQGFNKGAVRHSLYICGPILVPPVAQIWTNRCTFEITRTNIAIPKPP